MNWFQVGRSIQKSDTLMRLAIPAKLKLEIGLRFLATGDSLSSIQYQYRVPKCSISKFLPDVFDAIYESLRDYIRVPETVSEWNDIQKGFNDLWNFPHCVGCIEGKHILLQCPRNLTSQYYNYKGTFSIVLLAMVDHDYNFTFIDIGSYGNIADGGIFAKSSLMRDIENNQISLPEGAVILGDSAFPLKTYLMKPYPSRNDLSEAQKIYNYRHCHARHVIDYSLGMLTSRFRVFKAPIRLHPETVAKLVKSACALHNWIRKSNKEVMTMGTEDHDYGRIKGNDKAEAMANIMPSQHRHYMPEALERRDELARYFIGEGALSWQYQMIE
ncbi:putative nuclease HARBI1 isoform X2 [Halyomorpha halys]|uniref:putative nuclease HARBI1 isoform X2 n=1 Tax=Halyomorpha halys TaxID=286706 RepID=UPI0006D51465|nr:putative nuclease HARBI1 isoform X2 [Halyomorpha halys]